MLSAFIYACANQNLISLQFIGNGYFNDNINANVNELVAHDVSYCLQLSDRFL